MDFSKVFDMVSHYLLVKMKNLELILWDIFDRTLQVKICNKYSETQNISFDFHHGSVLRPTLFFIFINDVPNIIKSEIKLFSYNVKQLIRP